MFTNKALLRKRKAFTLIELLIVIAIIGILFIVLVSKVDFATDKAKATGVQTDFRSFQIAVETVAREKGGFNKFGWDTGDLNADHIRNSYDTGDTNQDGIKQDNEIWIGHKEYAETWTGVYTLIKPGTNVLDEAALIELEAAINANLDPKLHIRINADGTIIMANGATDPWGCEYTGRYLSNAVIDELDSGAIVFYSSGPNKVLNINTNVANGEAINFNKNGDVTGTDDLAIAVIYTYTNGYGEVKTTTDGFSNNIRPNNSAPGNNVETVDPGEVEFKELTPGLYKTDSNWGKILYTWDDLIELGVITNKGAVVDGMQDFLEGDLVIGNISSFPYCAFKNCKKLTGVYIPDNVWGTGSSGMSGEAFGPFSYCTSLKVVRLSENSQMRSFTSGMFYGCTSLSEIHIPISVKSAGYAAFGGCPNLKKVYYDGTIEDWLNASWGYSNSDNIGSPTVNGADLYCAGKLVEHLVIPESITVIKSGAFASCTSLKSVTFHDKVTKIEYRAFSGTNIESLKFPVSIETFGNYIFDGCTKIKTIEFDENSPITYLGSGTFRDNTSLTNIKLPNNIQKIGSYLFQDCTNLTNIEIPYGITEIGSHAFRGTGITSITLGGNITYMGTWAFYWCKDLKTINISDNSAIIFSDSFLGSGVQAINIGNNCRVGFLAESFRNTSLMEINIGNNVMFTAFEKNSLSNTDITTIHISEGVTEIGEGAFHSSELTSVYLPSTLETINQRAFGYCRSMTDIYYNGTYEMWQNIIKNNGDSLSYQWDYYTNYILHCIDGDYDKNGNVIN